MRPLLLPFLFHVEQEFALIMKFDVARAWVQPVGLAIDLHCDWLRDDKSTRRALAKAKSSADAGKHSSKMENAFYANHFKQPVVDGRSLSLVGCFLRLSVRRTKPEMRENEAYIIAPPNIGSAGVTWNLKNDERVYSLRQLHRLTI